MIRADNGGPPSNHLAAPDKRRPEKIKLKNVAYFSMPGNAPPKHHVHHAFHHNLTSKKPRAATLFFQKHPSKMPEIDEIL